MKKKINISNKHFGDLVERFGTSRQTVYQALCFYTNSDLAKKIRKAAKELLKEELRNIEELESIR